jgi:peptidoglycan/LPS O-acetylase OafA/YrhL
MKHVPALDGVRGLAIALVLVHQFSILTTPAPLAVRIVRPFIEVGWIGVTLFFVLSGYLITGILVDSKGRDGWLRTFYIRRSLRIFPLYYAVLVVAFLILPALGLLPWPLHQGYYWSYLVNWPEDLNPGYDGLGQLWSLSVEEQFYVVWAVLVALTGRRTLAGICLALIPIAFASRCVLVLQGDSDAAYKWTICRMDALASGALLALLVRNEAARQRLAAALPRLVWAALAVGVVVGAASRGLPRVGPITETVGHLALDFIFFVVVGAAALGAVPAFESATLRTLGKYSYAMYLFHLPLHHILRPWLQPNPAPTGAIAILGDQLLYLVVGMAATFAAALISWNLLEKPLLGLKRHFEV